MRYLFAITLCLFLGLNTDAKTLKVLFIGNSYTDVNNLPDVVKQIAANLGDTLIYQKSAPGGYTFEAHSTYAPTLQLINQGGWDYVVLQEQSQFPSFPLDEVEDGVFPYAHKLDSLIHTASPCAKTVFYMTWGRKNGDADNCPIWPPVCTYSGMDSLLQLRYTMMADSNKAWVSPVAKVWHYVRDHNPTIELYQADGSHPSTSGSYLAALSFYAVLFGKDPSLTTFTFGVNANDAGIIRQAAKLIAYDSLTKWRSFNPPLKASYTYTSAGNVFNFESNSEGDIVSYEWSFGDGTPNANLINPNHTFTASGSYQVCLKVSDTCGSDTYCKSLQIGTVSVGNVGTEKTMDIYPNPAHNFIYIEGLKSDCHFSIYSITGKRLSSGKVDASGYSIDISDLSVGIYYLELIDASGKNIFKWVKE